MFCGILGMEFILTILRSTVGSTTTRFLPPRHSHSRTFLLLKEKPGSASFLNIQRSVSVMNLRMLDTKTFLSRICSARRIFVSRRTCRQKGSSRWKRRVQGRWILPVSRVIMFHLFLTQIWLLTGFWMSLRRRKVISEARINNLSMLEEILL